MANIDFFSQNFSDNYRLARSRQMVEPDDGTYNIIRLPKFAFVVEGWLEITTAYGDAGATMSVGFAGNGETADPDGFLDTTYCDADATGVYRFSGDGQPGSQGKYFNDAAGMVTVTCDDNGGTVGTFWVFVLYTVIH